MKTENDLIELAEIAERDFELEIIDCQSLATIPDGEQLLRRKLEAHIRRMIDFEFERLMQIFYRIDLDEKKVKAAFATADIAAELTILILERLAQKVVLRRQYKAAASSGDWE